MHIVVFRDQLFMQIIQFLIIIREEVLEDVSIRMGLGEELSRHVNIRMIDIEVHKSILTLLGISKHQVDPFMDVFRLLELSSHNMDKMLRTLSPRGKDHISDLTSMVIHPIVCMFIVNKELAISMEELGDQFFEIFIHCSLPFRLD